MKPDLRNMLILISAPSSSVDFHLPNQTFLNPFGHFGFTPVTFFVAEPFTHVMETRFLEEALGVFSTGCTITGEALGVGVGVGLGDGTGGGSWVNFTLIVGSEKVKPAAERKTQPFFSPRFSVATL